MEQFRLVLYKRKHSTNIVGNPKREQGDDKDQEQHSPEAKILHKLLPCCSEAGKNAFALLQVGIKKRMAFHGTIKGTQV